MSLFEEEGSASRGWLESTAGASEGTAPPPATTCEWLEEPRGRWRGETSRVEWGQGCFSQRREQDWEPGEARLQGRLSEPGGVVSTCIPWMVHLQNGLAIKPWFYD